MSYYTNMTEQIYVCETPCQGCNEDNMPKQMQVQKLIKPRLAHFTEAKGKRVVTVAYKWHLDGKVEYGATLWRADAKSPTYTKEMRRKSNTTAMKRMEKNPVVLYVEAGKTKGHEVREKVRNAVKYLGVRGTNRHMEDEDMDDDVRSVTVKNPVVLYMEAGKAGKGYKVREDLNDDVQSVTVFGRTPVEVSENVLKLLRETNTHKGNKLQYHSMKNLEFTDRSDYGYAYHLMKV